MPQSKVTSITDALDALKQGPLRKLDDEARANPWLVIGIAALVAAVLGFLLGRKTRD